MAIKKGQIRYVKDGDANHNYPTNLTAEMLTTGAMFPNSIRITELSVSAGLFGMQFYLNDTPAMIGATVGVLKDPVARTTWTLNSDKITAMPIYSLRFDAKSLQRFQQVNQQLDSQSPYYILIDYSYETVS